MSTHERVSAAQQNHIDQNDQNDGSLAALGSQSDHSGRQPLGTNAAIDEAQTDAAQHEIEKSAEQASSKKGLKFWLIFPPLCVATILVALESTIVSTALPTIAAVLNAGNNYTWYANAYLLAK